MKRVLLIERRDGAERVANGAGLVGVGVSSKGAAIADTQMMFSDMRTLYRHRRVVCQRQCYRKRHLFIVVDISLGY